MRQKPFRWTARRKLIKELFSGDKTPAQVRDLFTAGLRDVAKSDAWDASELAQALSAWEADLKEVAGRIGKVYINPETGA